MFLLKGKGLHLKRLEVTEENPFQTGLVGAGIHFCQRASSRLKEVLTSVMERVLENGIST